MRPNIRALTRSKRPIELPLGDVDLSITAPRRGEAGFVPSDIKVHRAPLGIRLVSLLPSTDTLEVLQLLTDNWALITLEDSTYMLNFADVTKNTLSGIEVSSRYPLRPAIGPYPVTLLLPDNKEKLEQGTISFG